MRVVISAGALATFAALVAVACGGVNESLFGSGSGGANAAASTGAATGGHTGHGGQASGPASSGTHTTTHASSGTSHGVGPGSSSTSGGGGQGTGGSTTCTGTGLQCKAATDDCAAKGLPPTTISGKVYDPAGAVPLYNVYAYIPNGALAPIIVGNPTCTACQAPASGSPVVGALSDPTGTFTLSGGQWGVPSGDNLPLVLQVGKWRRSIVLPHVDACAANAIPDPATPAARLRLPAKTSEGDMPFIAFTSGCDPAECFLREIGIDDSEFVPPGSAAGHVSFYTGNDASGTSTTASMVPGGNTPAETYAWWSVLSNLKKYDMVFNSCECMSYDRGANAYAAMHDYLAGGGRLMATHYFYNWFAPPTGPADFQSVVAWAPGMGMTGMCPTDPTSSAPYCNYYVHGGTPKAAAFGTWLGTAGVTQLALTDTRWDMMATKAGATSWIDNSATMGSTATAPMFITFNNPVGTPAASQCGRASFSDLHVAGTSDDTMFPTECANADPGGSHAVNKKALEFLFFDMFSCVQDDTQPPMIPPSL